MSSSLCPRLSRTLVPPWSLLAYVLLCLFLHLQTSEAVEKFSVIGPDEPLIAVIGEDAVLPCLLSPAVSAEGMEVRWFRSQFHTFVHLYRNGRDENDLQALDYQGRTELIKKHIRRGSVALRIRPVRLSDEGLYHCFFENGTTYEEAILELKTAGVGSAPHIYISDHEAGGIRVVCNSTGWFPEPEVSWKEDNGLQIPPSSKEVSSGGDRLFRVEMSLVLVESSHQTLSCCIRNTLTGLEKEAAVFMSDLFFPKVSPWMVSLFIFLALFLLLIVLAVWYLRKRHKDKEDLITGMEMKIGLLSSEVEWRKDSRHRAKGLKCKRCGNQWTHAPCEVARVGLSCRSSETCGVISYFSGCTFKYDILDCVDKRNCDVVEEVNTKDPMRTFTRCCHNPLCNDYIEDADPPDCGTSTLPPLVAA